MWTVIAIAISACAYYVSVGLGEFWPAVWIAPIPILLVAFRSSWPAAALASFAAYYLGNLNVFTFLTRVMRVPLLIAALAGTALACALAVLAARFAWRRLPAWLAPFAFPVVWTAYEFITALLSPHGTSMNLAYSQIDCLPILQIASVTGLWGVTFVATLVPSAIAVAWSKRDAAALAPAAIVFIAVLGFGVSRLMAPPAQPTVRVGLTATDQGIEEAFATSDPTVALQVAHAYADRIARLAADGAQVIVLPEKFLGVTPADRDAVERVFSDAARAAHATVIVGFNRFTPVPPHNVAVVFGPGGQKELEYEKHHMLPGPETGYVIGKTPGLFTVPGARWGVEICKDMDFPSWARQYGERGVTMLAVPAWDFVRDGRLHSRMAVMRAVEEGFTMARVAQQGRLTFTDAYGRILAETLSSQLPDANLVANLAPGPGATSYTRAGDWFGWMCVLAVAAIFVLGLRK